jgi:UrcA family protein
MITALATLTLMLAAAPAPQDPVAAPATVSVRYHDLNLHTAAGQAELDRRIARAVNAVCPTPDLRVLHQVEASDNCREAATAAASKQRQVALASAGATTLQIGSSGR